MHAALTIAIMGGTGELGSGLALRWSRAGHAVVVGSRDAERAREAAQRIGHGCRGEANLGAAEAADIIVLAVPFAAHEETLTQIRPAVRGKIVVDAVVPLVPPKVGTAQLPAEGSAAQIAARLLEGEARVVSAFHNVAAAKLHADERVDCDVLVCGDDKDARAQVIDLVGQIGLRGIDAGPLGNSAAAEALTSVLITINRRYKVRAAGIRITGIPDAEAPST
ncbi:MAG TPA: NADPH-dependent F420 reductase [Casimicrobiaceae bacterium]|nr:NADPH-dependent F420 reductase [Casimicrobiaceae bacterium]